MDKASAPHNIPVQLLSWLAVSGFIFALFLVANDVPEALIETEMAIPVLSLICILAISNRADHYLQGPLPLAPVIALVGCDGSGKSTLSADLQKQLASDHPVEQIYLGLGSGELGNRIKQWPLVGRHLEKVLTRKASQTRDKKKKIPGLLTALVVFGFSVLRLRRFRRVLAFRGRGITVITDRYPQVEVAGFYDGPGLSAASAGSPAVAWLAARERRMYEWMSSFRPDVVLRLNVDAKTAFARKPDHKPELLDAKVAATSMLKFKGARIVDIDARAPYDKVLAEAISQAARVVCQSHENRFADEKAYSSASVSSDRFRYS